MQPADVTAISKLKTAIIAMVVTGTILLVVMLTISSRETIPDRARFLVNKTERYIVPEPLPGQFIFHELPGDSEEVFARFQDTVTWSELRKKDNPYHGFDLPDTQQWNAFVFYGEEVSLLRSLFFPPPSRWDSEGRWRY